MRRKPFLLVLTCILLSAFLLTACGQAPADSSMLPESSAGGSAPGETSGSSEAGESSEKPELNIDTDASRKPEDAYTPSAESDSDTSEDGQDGSNEDGESGTERKIPKTVPLEDFLSTDSSALKFPQYSSGDYLSYDEYFAEERFLERLELFSCGAYLDNNPNKLKDMGGEYRYTKGWDDLPPEEADAVRYESAPCDNLYLQKLARRTLIAGLPGIRQVFYFIDCLYLTTENAIWRCGRLGEDLTCVYEHPSRVYTFRGASPECIYFAAEGDPWEQNHEGEKPPMMEMTSDTETVLWRLHLPSGRADKICVLEDLPVHDTEVGDLYGFTPITNYAFVLYVDGGYWVYNAKTGEMRELAKIEGYAVFFCWDAWVRKYYRLNQ